MATVLGSMPYTRQYVWLSYFPCWSGLLPPERQPTAFQLRRAIFPATCHIRCMQCIIRRCICFTHGCGATALHGAVHGRWHYSLSLPISFSRGCCSGIMTNPCVNGFLAGAKSVDDDCFLFYGDGLRCGSRAVYRQAMGEGVYIHFIYENNPVGRIV